MNTPTSYTVEAFGTINHNHGSINTFSPTTMHADFDSDGVGKHRMNSAGNGGSPTANLNTNGNPVTIIAGTTDGGLITVAQPSSMPPMSPSFLRKQRLQ